MKVSIIIPNWNGRELLEKHLSSVIAAAGKSEIIVVDDASTDTSVTLVKEKFPSVKIIKKSRHEGFASTVNEGVAATSGDIVVLLNTDVVPEEGFLSPLLAHFEDPNVFAVACMDKSIEKDSTVLRGRGTARWRRGFFVHGRGDVDKKTTAWVSGGSGAFSKALWNELGGMDTLFNPFYWEDIDLSYRALKAGFRLVFEDKSVVTHLHEEGKIKHEFSPFFVRQIASRNQFQFIWKNTADRNFILSHILWTPLVLVRALLRFDAAFVIGYFLALVRFPLILEHRFRQKSLWRLSDRSLLPHLGE